MKMDKENEYPYSSVIVEAQAECFEIIELQEDWDKFRQKWQHRLSPTKLMLIDEYINSL